MRKAWVISTMAILIFQTASLAQDGKISGLVFGDYYYVGNHHLRSAEDQNGFWFRRIYFTYDQDLSQAFALRLRLEMNSPGDFSSAAQLEPFVKDAYLKWSLSRHQLILGLSPTPTWDVIEKIWGYRPVEKTPLDLQKFGGSRDFGVALKGAIDPGRRVSYHLMFANGSGTKGETNKGKQILLSLGLKLTPELFLEAYGDWEDRPGRTNRYLWQGFLVYQREEFRIAGMFSQQAREGGADGGTDRLEIASVFAAGRLTERAWAFARYDRTFDPNPDGEKIAYLPFDPTAKANLLIAGIDLKAADNVHIMPNVEAIFYDSAPGGRPDTDVLPRLTFFYTF